MKGQCKCPSLQDFIRSLEGTGAYPFRPGKNKKIKIALGNINTASQKGKRGDIYPCCSSPL